VCVSFVSRTAAVCFFCCACYFVSLSGAPTRCELGTLRARAFLLVSVVYVDLFFSTGVFLCLFCFLFSAFFFLDFCGGIEHHLSTVDVYTGSFPSVVFVFFPLCDQPPRSSSGLASRVRSGPPPSFLFPRSSPFMMRRANLADCAFTAAIRQTYQFFLLHRLSDYIPRHLDPAPSFF